MKEKNREQEALEKLAKALRIISMHYADEKAVSNSVNLQKVNKIICSQQPGK